MTDTLNPRPIFNGEDDYLPDEALDLIDNFWASLPDAWDARSFQGHTRSVTLTIDIDGVVGPMAQIEAAERLLKAATLIGCLTRNLRWEREQRR